MARKKSSDGGLGLLLFNVVAAVGTGLIIGGISALVSSIGGGSRSSGGWVGTTEYDKDGIPTYNWYKSWDEAPKWARNAAGKN